MTLDRTGNMRMVQELLGHANSAVTENYVGRSEDRLRETLADVLLDRTALTKKRERVA